MPLAATLVDLVHRAWQRVSDSRLGVAFAWSTGSFLVSQIIRVGSNLIMTRLLAPEMFGVMSIIMVVQFTITLLSDIGIKTGVIQSRRGEEPAFLRTAWTLEIARGALVWMLCLLMALGIHLAGTWGWLVPGTAWAAPELPIAIAVATSTSLIAGFQSVNVFTAARRIEPKRIAVIELSSQVTGIAVMIGLSLVWRSVWPLVIGGIVSSLVTVAASHRVLPGGPSRLGLDASVVRELLAIGGWIIVSSFAYALAINMDRIVLAGYVSSAELGIYAIALNIVSMVEAVGVRFVVAIGLPALSETVRNQPHRLREQMLRLRWPFDLGMLAAAGLLCATGQMIITILFDPRYTAAGPMLQILSFTLVFMRYGFFGVLAVAHGATRYQAMMMFIKLVAAIVTIVPLVKFYGLYGGLFAVAFHSAATLPYVFWIGHKYGVNDWRHEALVLLAWPAGFGVGLAGVWLMGALFGLYA